MNKAKAFKTFSRTLALVLTLAFILNSVPVFAADYRYTCDLLTYENGKYFIQQTASGEIVYDKNGNVVISPGRYCRAEYLGGDLFVVYKIQDGYNVSKMHNPEMSYPYLLDVKKGTVKEIKLKFESTIKGIDVKIYPYNGKYAKVENAAFYAWTTMRYYQFIDKNGKTIMTEKPYSYCSDMIKVGEKYYFFTKGDELSFSSGADKDSLRKITKRDINGKALKSITFPEKTSITVKLVKISSKYYIWVEEYKDKELTYLLYNTNLKRVTKYTQEELAEMKEYDPVGENKESRRSELYQETIVDGRRILERDWVFITPFTTKATSFDVASASTDIGAWVMLWDSKVIVETYGIEVDYILDGPGINQAFMFEKVGEDSKGNGKYRIFAAHSGRQLKSSYDKESKVTRLVQGSYKDTDSKGKIIKEQIFTVIYNDDGSISIKNNKGKYLTMAYGSTEANTQLVFADYANGDNKQKFSVEGFSLDLVRTGEAFFDDNNNW